MIPTLRWFCVFLIAVPFVTGQDEPLRIPPDEAMAAANKRVLPAYPVAALQLKIDGTVIIDAYVLPDGSVYDTVIVVGNPILTAAAQEALKHWSFKPFHENGHPARAIARVVFSCSLKPRKGSPPACECGK